MRAILIDPFAETITEIDYSGDYRDIYKLIRIEDRPFIILQIAYHENMFLDDEGLYQPGQRFFRFAGYAGTLAGCGLIIGEDEDGESAATELPLAWVEQKVSFTPNIRFLGTESTTREGDTPFGPGTIIENKAIFGTEN